MSKKLVVIVQNGGDSTIKAKLIMERDVGDLEVAKHQNKKVDSNCLYSMLNLFLSFTVVILFSLFLVLSIEAKATFLSHSLNHIHLCDFKKKLRIILDFLSMGNE